VHPELTVFVIARDSIPKQSNREIFYIMPYEGRGGEGPPGGRRPLTGGRKLCYIVLWEAFRKNAGTSSGSSYDMRSEGRLSMLTAGEILFASSLSEPR